MLAYCPVLWVFRGCLDLKLFVIVVRSLSGFGLDSN